MAKFDSAWEGNPVWQTGLPALASHPTYHVNVIKLKWEIIWAGGLLHLSSGLPYEFIHTLDWCAPAALSQRAKKVASDSPRLVDFAIGLVNSVFNLPDGQVMFFEKVE